MEKTGLIVFGRTNTAGTGDDGMRLNPFAILNHALDHAGKIGKPIVQSAIWRLWWDESFGPAEDRASTVAAW